MRSLSLGEIIDLHQRLIEQSGGSNLLRDHGLLDSAVAQPLQTFGGQDLYPTLDRKAATLCYSLVRNHPFVDGNKRIGHAAMETLLVLNGYELRASVEDAEATIRSVATGTMSREQLAEWIRRHWVEVVQDAEPGPELAG